MPRLPDVPGVVRIDWHQTLGQDTGMVTRTFWGYGGGIPTQSDINAMASQASASWRTTLEPDLGTFHSLNFTVCTDLSSATGAVGVDTTTATGADTGDPLAADTAMRIKFLQGRRYRGGHPGLYLGGFVEDRLQDAQTWSSATLSALSTDVTGLLAAILGAGGGGVNINRQVNVSYYSGFTVVTSPTTGRARNVPTLRVTPLVTTITGFEIDVHVSSQRRRSLIRS